MNRTLKSPMPKILMAFLTLGLLLNAGCASKSKKNEPEQPAAQVRDDDAKDSDSDTATGLTTVYFDFDSSTLTSDAKQSLESNAKYLKNNSGVEIQIEGHCDERGSVQYNLALGERRAKSTKKYLEALGVSSSRISTVSYGKERPVALGHEESAWSQNRRANFVVTSN